MVGTWFESGNMNSGRIVHVRLKGFRGQCQAAGWELIIVVREIVVDAGHFSLAQVEDF